MIVSDIIERVRGAVGRCDDATLFEKLTSAIQILADKRNEDLLVGYLDLCACSDGKTLTLPRDIETPLVVDVNGEPKFFRNKWFEFHANGQGAGRTSHWSWDDRGNVVTFMDIIGHGQLIAVADIKTDIRTILRVFGYDNAGNWIRTQSPDGTWTDGFLVPINLITDFPFGVITPDPLRLLQRYFTTTKMQKLTTVSGNHELTTGAGIILSLVNAPLPNPLINGAAYFARVISDTEVSLHASQSGAQTNTGIVTITSANPASIVSLTDSRVVAVLTEFNSSDAHNQRDGMIVVFSGTTMPSPVIAGTEYYTHVVDDNNFTIHATFDEAISNLNPIDVTTPGTAVVASAKQDIDPVTHLDFAVPHNLVQGDAVTIVNNSGSYPEPLLGGVTYFIRYVSSSRVTLHSTLSDATTGDNPIVLLSSGSGATSVVKSIPCSANLGTANNITADSHNLTQHSTFSALATTRRERTSNVAKLKFASPHGYSSGDLVTVASVGGSDYNVAKVAITVVTTLQISYPDIGANEADTADTAGRVTKIPTTGDFVQFTTSGTFPAPITQNTVYRAEPPMSTDTFTLYDTSGSPIDVLATGTGQLFLVISRVFTIGFTSDFKTVGTKITTGTEVKISSTGTLPATSPAIDSATTYFARKISDVAIELFDTLAHANDNALRVSASRARASNVATIVTNAAHTFTTGDFVDVSGLESTKNGELATVTINVGGTGYTESETATITDGTGHTAEGQLTVAAGVITAIRITNGGSGFTVAGALTITGQSSGSIDADVVVATINNGVAVASSTYNVSRKQITVVNATKFTYSSVGLNEPTTVDVGGSIRRSNIKVTGVGIGDVSLVFERTVTAVPASSLLRMSDSNFLLEGATIQFETDGTLPSPLLPITDYILSLSGGFLQAKTTLGNIITLTDIGSGAHDMVIRRNFNVQIPTTVDLVSNNVTNGDSVKLSSTVALPSPLIANTDYFLRRISDDMVEIYDTAAHAINTASSTGLITPVNTGTGVHSMIQYVANFDVKRITRVSRSAGDGFLKLYCWDSGRTDSLTLIGNYYPDETEPTYRRIIIGECCQWVRMRYKRKMFKIRSMDDFIPIRSEQALIMMLKALELYDTEFSDKGKEYEDLAEHFLNERQIATEGPDSPTIQFNTDIFTNSGDEYMT